MESKNKLFLNVKLPRQDRPPKSTEELKEEKFFWKASPKKYYLQTSKHVAEAVAEAALQRCSLTKLAQFELRLLKKIGANILADQKIFKQMLLLQNNLRKNHNKCTHFRFLNIFLFSLYKYLLPCGLLHNISKTYI